MAFNSLKIKILGLVTLSVVVIVTIASIVTYRNRSELLFEIASRDNEILTETIKSSIAQAMRAGHSEEVRVILSRIKANETIRGLRIVDENGRVLNSAREEELGKIVSSDDLTPLRAGKGVPLHISSDHKMFQSYMPIFNSPSCHSCHDPGKFVLGFLNTELSLGYMQEHLSTEKTSTVISTIILVLLIMVSVTIFLVVYVDRPLRNLIAAMHQVQQGHFVAPPVVTSSSELQTLSESFREMTTRLQQQIATTVEHERELAVAQEKLAHTHEIHAVNLKLEEKLIEIESLNAALEERVAEVENASYKIADLAGVLEDRNTSLEQAVARLSSLYEVGLAINSTIELDQLFELVMQSTLEALRGQIGYLLLYDGASDQLEVGTVLGWERQWEPGHKLPLKPNSISTWVIRTRSPLLVTDMDEYPQFSRISSLGYERKTLLCVPLMVKDEIIGTLSVVNRSDDIPFSVDDLELLSTIAAQAAIAVNNARLYEDQQQTYLNTIHALVSAIEASDSYTRGHSERVTRYSLELARHLELPADRLKVVERAGILHDIGKIGINLALLHKEGKLTPEDINELRQHPLIGMKIVEPIHFLGDVKQCIVEHHERYDGHGYPFQVGHADLLLESRILALADAFDAMTSDRPYRKALPLEVAIKELEENAGTQFDPALVTPFIDVLRSGLFEECIGSEELQLRAASEPGKPRQTLALAFTRPAVSQEYHA